MSMMKNLRQKMEKVKEYGPSCNTYYKTLQSFQKFCFSLLSLFLVVFLFLVKQDEASFFGPILFWSKSCFPVFVVICPARVPVFGSFTIFRQTRSGLLVFGPALFCSKSCFCVFGLLCSASFPVVSSFPVWGTFNYYVLS